MRVRAPVRLAGHVGGMGQGDRRRQEVILASSHPSGLTGQGKDLGFSLSEAADAAGEKSDTV